MLTEADKQFLKLNNRIADLEFSGEIAGELIAKVGIVVMFGTLEEKFRLKNILAEFVKVTGIDKREV